MNTEVRRGEIYCIEILYSTGHEMERNRPGIVVSCDELNRSSPVVNVVMCSASNNREMPEHITIRATPVKSTALCEHIYTVDKSRLTKWIGCCSKKEMEAVDIGMMAGLGLAKYDLARALEDEDEAQPVSVDTEALIIAQTERDTYKGLYERLIDRMTMELMGGA